MEDIVLKLAKIKHWTQSNGGAQYFILLSMTAAATVMCFWGATQITFGPIDDHEIFRFLGSDGQISLLEIPKILWQETEVGEWGQTSRYRPSYYLIRIVETALFRTNAGLWFGFRVLTIGTMCFLFSIIILKTIDVRRKYIGGVLSMISIFSFLSLSAWSDIVLRLGPAEFYLAGGFLAFILFSLITFTHPEKIFSFIGLFCSAVVVIGSKENGIFVALPFMILCFYHVRIGVLSTRLVGSLAILCAGYSTTIFLSPLISVQKTGSDVYGRNRSLSSSVLTVSQFMQSNTGKLLASYLIIILLSSVWHLYNQSHNKKAELFTIVFSLLLFAQLVTEQIFYLGNLSELRYTIISEISEMILMYLAVACCLKMFTVLLGKTRTMLYTINFAVAFIFLFSLPTAFIRTLENNHQLIDSKITATRAFQTSIAQIVSLLKKDSYNQIVLQLNNIWNYEPAYAVLQYINYHEDNVSSFLSLKIPSVNDGLETDLLRQLEKIRDNGSDTWHVNPITEKLSNRSLCVVFGDAGGDPEVCATSVNL